MYRISKVETGRRLRKLMNWHGVTVREVQEEMELESPQAIYKWLNGRALPSTENLLILGRLLNVSMEDILVAEQNAEERERKHCQVQYPQTTGKKDGMKNIRRHLCPLK